MTFPKTHGRLVAPVAKKKKKYVDDIQYKRVPYVKYYKKTLSGIKHFLFLSHHLCNKFNWNFLKKHFNLQMPMIHN